MLRMGALRASGYISLESVNANKKCNSFTFLYCYCKKTFKEKLT